MIIVEGFNGVPTEIRVAGNSAGSIELWIDEQGRVPRRESLSYLTVNEAILLRRQLKDAILKASELGDA